MTVDTDNGFGFSIKALVNIPLKNHRYQKGRLIGQGESTRKNSDAPTTRVLIEGLPYQLQHSQRSKSCWHERSVKEAEGGEEALGGTLGSIDG